MLRRIFMRDFEIFAYGKEEDEEFIEEGHYSVELFLRKIFDHHNFLTLANKQVLNTLMIKFADSNHNRLKQKENVYFFERSLLELNHFIENLPESESSNDNELEQAVFILLLFSGSIDG